MRATTPFRLNTSLLCVGISFALAGPAAAGCSNNAPATGTIVTCTAVAPNPDTVGVMGLPGATGVRVNVQGGATISTSVTNGIRAQGADWTIINSGLVSTSGSPGVGTAIVLLGGTVENRAGGVIASGFRASGVFSSGGALQLTNAGRISGDLGGVSVSSDVSSTVTNNAGGEIASGRGVSVAFSGSAGHTLNNFGILRGVIGFGAGDDTLLLGTGSVLEDNTGPGSGALGQEGRNTLILQGSGIEDALFRSFQQIDVRANADWSLTGRYEAEGALRTDVGPGARIELSGVLTATSLEKVGAGELVITGNATAITGANELRAGALFLAGRLGGSLRVASGARLAGMGTVGPVVNEGLIDPGQGGIGTLNINGNYTHAAGATYRVDITPTGASDRLAVAGLATLNGGTVDVVKVNGQYTGSTRYNILSTTGGVAGRFAQLTQNMPFLNLFLSYDANNVFLNVGRSQTTFAQVCDVADTCAVARVIDAISTSVRPDNPLAPILDVLTLQNVAGANTALSTFSGRSYATLTDMVLQSATSMRMPVDAAGAPPQRGIRIRAHDKSGDLSDGGRASWDSRGLALDFDAGIGENLWAGATLSTQRVDSNIGFDRADIDMDGIEGRIGWAGPRLQTSLAVGRTEADMSLERYPTIRSSSATGSASSQRDARLDWARGEVATRFDMGTWAVQPFVDVLHQRLESDAVSEDLSGLGLIGAVSNHRRTSSALGARASGSWGGQAWTFEPMAELAWRHVLSDKGGDFVGALSGAPTQTFTSQGIREDSDGWHAQLALTARRGPGFAGTLGYGLQRASDADVHGINAALRWTW